MKLQFDLQSVEQTLLITLYAKAMESHHAQSILNDHHAAELVEQMGFDFSILKVHHDQQVSLACRASQFDQCVRDFLSKHEHPLILDLGCGMDTRFDRLGKPDHCQWINVDFEHVIAMRQAYHAKHDNVRDIAASLEQTDWFDAIACNQPTMVLAEGVFPYLHAVAIKNLLGKLSEHFQNPQLVFDAYNKLGTWLLRMDGSIRVTGAKLCSTLRDIACVIDENQLKPNGFYHADHLPHFSRLSRNLIRCWQALPIFSGLAGLYQCGL
ncbi:MAG: class I SAM-dependent methyltransferase [Phycisphaeraceae bacterium JB051]